MHATVLFRALAALEAAKDATGERRLDIPTWTKVTGAWAALKVELEAENLTVPVQAEVAHG